MSRKKYTSEEVAEWVAVNCRRTKKVRLLTNEDIARRIGTVYLKKRGRPDFPVRFTKALVCDLLSGNWNRAHVTQRALNGLRLLLALCAGLEITPAELLSRPDDMSLLTQDGRRKGNRIADKRKQRQQTLEQAEMQALLESLGLDE